MVKGLPIENQRRLNSMNIWFIGYLFLNAMGLGMNLVKHGESKDGEYNFWVSLITTIITVGIVVMAIKGGF